MLSPYLSIFPISGTTVQAKTQRSLDRLSKVKKNPLNTKKTFIFHMSHCSFFPSIVMLLTAEQPQEKVSAASEVFRG